MISGSPSAGEGPPRRWVTHGLRMTRRPANDGLEVRAELNGAWDKAASVSITFSEVRMLRRRWANPVAKPRAKIPVERGHACTTQRPCGFRRVERFVWNARINAAEFPHTKPYVPHSLPFDTQRIASYLLHQYWVNTHATDSPDGLLGPSSSCNRSIDVHWIMFCPLSLNSGRPYEGPARTSQPCIYAPCIHMPCHASTPCYHTPCHTNQYCHQNCFLRALSPLHYRHL